MISRCLLAAVLVLMFSGSAEAAPFTAGTGHDAQVAVGADGTGHVVWLTEDRADGLAYCRVARDGGACERTDALAFPGGAGAQATHAVPQVFVPSDERVVLVASCWNCGAGGVSNRTFVWTSADRGQSFASPVERGRGLVAAGQGAFLPATDTIVTVGISKLLALGDAPLDAPPITVTTSPTVASPAVAPAPRSDQLVHISSDQSRMQFALYAGAEAASAIDVASNWLLGQPVAGGESASGEGSLASGPSGLQLAYRRTGGGNVVRIHRYDAAARTFDGGSDIVRGGGADEPDLAQNAAGALALVWKLSSYGGRLRYARSGTGGGVFSPPALLARDEPFADPEVAAGPGGSGFAVWRGASSAMRVAALPPAVAEAYRGPLRTVRRSDARLHYDLRVPRDCVVAGQRFIATLRWSRRGGGSARVHRVRFRIPGQPPRVDSSAPFRQTLTVPAAAAPATRIAVQAHASARDGGGVISGRTVPASITVCDT
ncbi:hypothetical protein [Conexibacter woesei]|uniref:Exo-alpha-sialidase n=1 Tax=Conexibacter woesei (strain DSM 14684 / CCUG 47730 / CIP 108061 / JCM 11494 / NBRC 100937 / ID131577) TaxID=469383 RepID=D3F495_CONWI|nr:hypothetical protein [Conexibacter woesei]ADB50467.1 hypothetical protein Cwoe_2041 [Conexibacter woesei DSM 14684]